MENEHENNHKHQHLPNAPDAAWSILSETQKFLPLPTTTSAAHDHDHDPLSSTRIACMSDTHGKHRNILIPKCDILIHGGDFTKSGEQKIIQDLADFFVETVQRGDAKEVICIAGNHDISFHRESCEKHWGLFHPKSTPQTFNDALRSKKYLQERCTYLEDESTTYNDNVSIYGSPWTPTYFNCWAFMKDRDIIHSQWDLIPNEVDVLVTHGPPLGRGDFTRSQVRAGCVNLLEQVQNRIQPRLHVFGHIHEGSGSTFDGETLFVNASNCTIKYSPENPCVVVDLPHDKNLPARIVVPKCTLTGQEVLDWLKYHGYDNIYPYFENRKPRLFNGDELVCDDITVDDLAGKLKVSEIQMWNCCYDTYIYIYIYHAHVLVALDHYGMCSVFLLLFLASPRLID